MNPARNTQDNIQSRVDLVWYQHITNLSLMISPRTFGSNFYENYKENASLKGIHIINENVSENKTNISDCCMFSHCKQFFILFMYLED